MKMSIKKKHQNTNLETVGTNNGWFKTTILPIVIAAIVSQISWILQFNLTFDEKVDEKKFGVFNQVSENIAQIEMLGFGKQKIQLQTFVDTNGKPFNSIEDKAKYEAQLKKNLPDEYQDMIEYDKQMPKLYGSLLMAEAFYGEETDKAITQYMENALYRTPVEHLQFYFDEMKKQGKEIQEIHTIDTREYIEIINKDTNKYRTILLNEMKDELEYLE
jgi:hypothetical protein